MEVDGHAELDGGADGGHTLTLSDLTLFYDDLETRLGSHPPSHENLKNLVQALYDEWVDGSVEMHEINNWAIQRYQLDAAGDFGFGDFEHAANFRKYQYKNLYTIAKARGLFEDDGEVVDQMESIKRVMGIARRSMVDMFILFNRMEGSRGNRIPQKIVEDEDEETLEEHKSTSLTSFQHLLINILKRMEIQKFRKCGKNCYFQIYTSEGFPSHAYAYACSIKDEVYKVQKEVDFSLWKKFTQPRDNPRCVIDHLVDSNQREFPSIDVGAGRYFSFENVLYDIEHDLAFAHDDSAGWRDYANAIQAARKDATPYPIPNEDTVAINFFPIVFRHEITPETVASFDPDKIATPAFERILNTQRFTAETKRDAYVMTGRLFFLCNQFDRWARTMFIIGGGGTGKSTMANWIMHCIPSQFVTQINSNFEEQFGLGPLCSDEKRVCLCTELTEDLKFKQEEWQICSEGGILQVAKKGIDSFPHTWKQHMFFIGNQFPRKWKNNAKQVSRRSWILLFRYLVPKADVDHSIIDQLKAETDQLLRKCVCMYINKARANPDVDLEAPGMMSEEVKEFMESMEANIDPLTSFLNSGRFTFAESYYMPLEEFKREYFEYRKSNGFAMVGWTKDHYFSVFMSMALAVQRTTLPYRGAQKMCDFIMGVQIVPNDEDMDDE